MGCPYSEALEAGLGHLYFEDPFSWSLKRIIPQLVFIRNWAEKIGAHREKPRER